MGLFVILLAANYVFLQNLGRFFDSFIPLVLLSGHFLCHNLLHKIVKWGRESRELRDLRHAEQGAC